jgi:hypothetical protein
VRAAPSPPRSGRADAASPPPPPAAVAAAGRASLCALAPAAAQRDKPPQPTKARALAPAAQRKAQQPQRPAISRATLLHFGFVRSAPLAGPERGDCAVVGRGGGGADAGRAAPGGAGAALA